MNTEGEGKDIMIWLFNLSLAARSAARERSLIFRIFIVATLTADSFGRSIRGKVISQKIVLYISYSVQCTVRNSIVR